MFQLFTSARNKLHAICQDSFVKQMKNTDEIEKCASVSFILEFFLVSHYNEYFESAMRFSVQENSAQKENPNGFLSQSYADI